MKDDVLVCSWFRQLDETFSPGVTGQHKATTTHDPLCISRFDNLKYESQRRVERVE